MDSASDTLASFSALSVTAITCATLCLYILTCCCQVICGYWGEGAWVGLGLLLGLGEGLEVGLE